MNKILQNVVGLLCILLILGLGSCKSSSNNTSSKTTKTNDKNKVAADTSSPIKKLQGLGSNAKTEVVEEAKSGMNAPLPFDNSVRTGTLPNGMRYYLRQNPKPEQRVELRLAINAGSMQEEDDQRGLAHFVEHMCFNGTKNFEKNELINFLELTGVRFGADLNAYTSFDETVYMLQLPTDKTELIDKGLLVMHDWAGFVSFTGEEIDKERGVIESEWRTGLGADERMRQVYWPKLFYKSRYADRLPIGTQEVIKGAPYERLRTFYKDWYRPNLMALVVIGDINVDEIEAKVKTMFADLTNPDNNRPKELYEVPNHKETFVAVATDKEATRISIQMLYKHQPFHEKTIEDYRTTLTARLYSMMLNERFNEIKDKADSPFLFAGGGYGGFVRAKDAYFLSAAAKENRIEDCIKTILTEQERVRQHGFTDTELERAKLAVLKSVERNFNERDKITSARLASECVAHFLQGEPMVGLEKELAMTKEFLPKINLSEVNALTQKWISEENRSFILTAPQKEGLKIPTEEEIRALLEASKAIKVEAYKDKFLDMPLMEKEPVAGKVVETKNITDQGINLTELKLSNGVRIILKPTDFQNDQILLNAFSPGGHSLYSDKDFMTASNADDIVARGGVGPFDRIALDKKLTGKSVRVAPYIAELNEGFQGSSTIEDFETMLQLIHLYATTPRKDKDAFETFINELEEETKNQASNPQAYFIDQFTKISNSNHPRRKGLLSPEDIKQINFERAHEIYKDRFSDFSDFTFTLVGNFDPEKIKPLLEKYIASLPATQRVENWKDVGVKFPVDGAQHAMKKGLAPQSFVILSFGKEEEWSREKAFKVNAMVRVLNIMVRENLREDKGGVYSPFVGGGMSRDPKGMSNVVIFFQCAPDNVENLVNAVKEEIQKLQNEGPTEDNLKKVQETERRTLESNLKKNNFWLSTLSDNYQHNDNPLQIFDNNKMIDNLKKEDIQKAAKNYIDVSKGVIVTLKPEKEETGKP